MNSLENIPIINILPGIFLVSASLIAMLSIAIKRNHKLIFGLTTGSLLGVFIYLLVYVKPTRGFTVEPLFVIDGFGTFITGLIVMSALAVSLISYAYFEQREERKEEYYILLLLATLGSAMLVISKHFVSLFLGLEILSIALYSMVAYLRKRPRSDEAGIKYLILAAFSSAFLLFGMALVYTVSGTMDFTGIAKHLSENGMSSLMLAGLSLMIVGVGFKLGLVPFHMWTPDVYEGAPAPVTAFIATISKGGMVVLLVRFFSQIYGYQYPVLMMSFTIIAIASMFVGNFLALRQNNVKRILAYSSIAHLGYLMVAFLAGGQLGIEAVSFYLVAYFLTNIGAFGIISILSDQDRDAERLEDYQDLMWRHPIIAACFTAMLLSLAGIPLTAGFVGKFYLIASGVDAQRWLLVVMLALNSVIGLFYYIKIIAVMFDKPAGSDVINLRPRLYLINLITLFVLSILMVWYGVYPQGLIERIHDFVK